MIVTKQEIIDAYAAYTDSVLDPNKKMNISLAYKIAKNEAELKKAFYTISRQIDGLRSQYNWNQSEDNNGLSNEDYQTYQTQYEEIVNSTIDINFIMIKMSEITFEVTIREMRFLSIMIEAE